jgi:predicted nucleic-acid-binding protein
MTRDDPLQAPIADTIMAQPVFVSLTVVNELVWTLGGRVYKMPRAAIAEVLRVLITTTTVTVAHEAGVSWAIERFAAGADLADMIHLVAAGASDSFISFEKHLATLAGPDTPIPIERAA